MENITLGQIVGTITVVTLIGGFFIGIFKWYKKTFTDRFISIENRLDSLEEKNEHQEKEIKDSKEERFIMINGLLACLKGLHNDLHCNGPVTRGINEIENYLITKTHE